MFGMKYVRITMSDLEFIVVMDEEDDPAEFARRITERTGYGVGYTVLYTM